MGRRRLVALSLLAATVLLAGSCGGGKKANSVDTTLADFTITLSSSTAKAGEVTFKIKNNGPSAHEFVVFKTDLAQDALPTVEENGVPIVDEEGEGLELIDEAEEIAVGATPELKITLAAGAYVVLCNVTAHYQQGMHAAFTVTS
jgi:uncharacterized cupredoxin-like copper-binding protein